MIAQFDAQIQKHEETIRRAEQRYTLMTALHSEEPAAKADESPRQRLSALLRRIAGSPAAA